MRRLLRGRMALRTTIDRGDTMRPVRHSDAPLVAHRNPKFMESAAARPIRILGEYLDPLVRLRREGVGDTIVMFGSARIEPRDRAVARLKRLQGVPKARMTPARRATLRQKLHAARSAVEMSRYYEEARELARRITAW